jgi:flavin reductase (DIM6/NTAB) family NADH-FMN oxidoreductase RutF
MFQTFDLSSYYRLLHPRPVVVVTSTCSDGRVNAMACSWFTPVSEDPPTVLIVLDVESYTAGCINWCGEFVINVLPAELLSKVWIAGSVSGREVDKIKAMGVKLMRCRKLNTYAIEESVAVIEAQVINKLEVSDSKVFIGRVVDAYVKEGVVGRYGWDLSKVSIPLHNWGRSFYILDKGTKHTYMK